MFSIPKTAYHRRLNANEKYHAVYTYDTKPYWRPITFNPALKLMRCSFCNKKSKYSCDFITQDNKQIIIQGCEKHKELAFLKQEQESLKDRVRNNLTQR